MTYTFRCPKTQLIEWVDGPGQQRCPACGELHEAQLSGAPPMKKGVPAVIGDRLKPHMDWAAGQVINSRAQRDRVYKQKGLRLKSVAEHKQQFPGTFEKPPGVTGYSYPGQKVFRSSAEVGGVRTKDGRLVL